LLTTNTTEERETEPTRGADGEGVGDGDTPAPTQARTSLVDIMSILAERNRKMASLVAQAKQESQTECSTFHLNFFEPDISLRMSSPNVLRVSSIMKELLRRRLLHVNPHRSWMPELRRTRNKKGWNVGVNAPGCRSMISWTNIL